MDIDVGQGLCCLATISSFFFPGHIALAADAPSDARQCAAAAQLLRAQCISFML